MSIRARGAGDSAAARAAGSINSFVNSILGLAPQALCYRPLRGLGARFLNREKLAKLKCGPETVGVIDIVAAAEESELNFASGLSLGFVIHRIIDKRLRLRDPDLQI